MKIFKQRKVILFIGIIGAIMFIYQIFKSQNNYDIIKTNQIIESNSIEKKEEEEEEEGKEKSKIIIVHIAGEVKKPGIVKVKENSRIEDVVEIAGGLTEYADISNVNLAYVVKDGIKIIIPSIENEEFSKKEIIIEDAGKNIIVSDDKNNANSIININTATQTELEELPGIGASIAGKIVEYRDKNGKFKSIEDIKNVTGIGDSKFDQIKNFIKI